MEDPRVDMDLMKLAETTANHATLLQDIIRVKMASSLHCRGGVTSQARNSEGNMALIRNQDLVWFDSRGVPLDAFIRIAGMVAGDNGLAVLAQMSRVCHSFASGVKPVIFLLRCIKVAPVAGMTTTNSEGKPVPVLAEQGQAVVRGLAGGFNMIKQGVMSMRPLEGQATAKLEELEDQVTGLRKEREQLYAQVQADALLKKHQEQMIKELSDGGASGAEGPNTEDLKARLAETESMLAEMRSKMQQQEEQFTRAKKVLVAEVHKLRQNQG